MNPPRKRRLLALSLGPAVSVVAWTVVALLLQIGFVKNTVEIVDGYLYDRLFVSHQTPPDELVIVDLQTTADPVDRSKCAELIEGLRRAGARTIGIDLLFLNPTRTRGDTQLVRATATFNNVIHAFNLAFREGEPLRQEISLRKHALELADRSACDNCLTANIVQAPFLELLQASHGMAHISFAPDEDAMSDRRFPLVLCFNKQIYPGLPLQMVRRFWGAADDRCELHFGAHECDEVHEDDFILFKLAETSRRKIPVDQYGRVLINFIPPQRFERHALNDAVELLRAENDTTFKNKMILLVNSGNHNDYSHKNPLGDRFLPNWVIHASTISQILNQEYIVEHDGVSSMTFVFFGAIMFSAWLLLVEPRWQWIKPRTGLVLLIAGLLLLAVAGLKLYFGDWTGFVLPLLILCASYLAAKHYLDRWKPPTVELPQYEDFEMQIQEKSKGKFLVDVIRSPAGEEAEGEFSLDVEALAEVLRKLRSFNAGAGELKTLGTTLFNALFQPKILRRYDESLGLVGDSSLKRLRLKLRIEPPALSILPWEFMYDPKRQEHLVLFEKFSIVRFLMVPQKVAPLTVAPPLKILVLISSPLDYPPLEVEKEQERISQALAVLTQAGRVQLDFLSQATIAEVRKKLDHGYHVLHYIGHGDFIESERGGKGGLVFENESRTGELVDADRMKLLLDRGTIRLVILNACETAQATNLDYFLGVAPMLVSAGIPAVIAMQYKIPDQSAVQFSEEFYQALAKNYQVDAAVEAARKAMALERGLGKVDWGIPVLFMRSPDGILFKLNFP